MENQNLNELNESQSICYLELIIFVVLLIIDI